MSLIKKTTASIALVAIASGLFANGASAYSSSQVEAANKLADKGIVVKHSNPADYQLDRQVLRQEIAAVARGLAGLAKKDTCSNTFKDVSATKPNTWACFSVEALSDAGLIAKNENFRPEANITKAEAIGMIVKARYGNEYNPVAGNGDWQKQVVDFAHGKGIVDQFSNYTTPATRGFIFEAAAKSLNENNAGDDLLCSLLGECGNNDPKKPDTPSKPDNSIQRNDTDLVVSLSPESPSNGAVVADSDRAELLAFDVTAGKSDVTLRKASLKFTGLGNEKIVTKLAIYSNDVKISKGEKTFNNKGVAELSFDRDVVVKAGETKTLVVTATIVPGTDTYNQSVRVSLTNLEASTTVRGAELTGATLTPYKVSNRAEFKLETTSANGRVNLGEESTLYNFSVREESKKEGLVVKSVTFEEGANNGVDLDNLSDLALYVGSTKVDAKFSYQKSKVVASLDYTVKSGEKVNFVLKGKIVDDLNKKLTLKLDNVYAVGASTQVAAKSTEGTLVTVEKDVIGSAVNFTFNREGTNEVSKGADDVKIGELVFNTTSDYTATLKVTVTGSAATQYENLELDGDTPENNSSPYTFKDVDLSKGSTKLPLTVDVKSTAVNNTNLNFKVEVVQLEESVTGEKLTAANLKKVVNNTELSKNVVVKAAGIKLTAETVNNTSVVPKGNQQVVLYKGKLDLSGGEDITLDSLSFAKDGGEDLDDYISGVTLNIGGKTFSGDVNTTTINFSSIYAKIEKNSKGVNLLLSATLKDVELTANKTLKVKASEMSASSDNVSGNVAEAPTAATSTTVTLTPKTSLQITNVTNELKDNVLAGNNNVEIGSFKVKDTSSDILFNSFKVKVQAVTGDASRFSSALRNLRLVDGSEVIASGGQVEGEYVKFDSFTLKQFGKDRTLKIVADLAALSSAGGESAPFMGTLKFTEVVVDSDDVSNTTPIVIASEEVKVVPAIVTYSVTKGLSEGNSQATVKVTVDKGNNDISKLNLTKLLVNDTAKYNVALLKVNNDTVAVTEAATEIAANPAKEVTNLSSFEVVMTVNLEAANVSTGTIILKRLQLVAEDNNGASYPIESITEDLSLGSFKE
ncbi:hypothetical protein DLH72_01710 [Candidatus Gracilibacteria bacterium]|nr:MAG: hypothetical protein DLH72_01710 [Candidatus Gracilibacteria bacterium]